MVPDSHSSLRSRGVNYETKLSEIMHHGYMGYRKMNSVGIPFVFSSLFMVLTFPSMFHFAEIRGVTSVFK